VIKLYGGAFLINTDLIVLPPN